MKKEITVEIPLCPSYIRTNMGMVGIEEFTDEELDQITVDWGNALKARKRTIMASKV